MSRPARHDIDLSALPTVADLEDDDLIDRDAVWHAHQATKQQQQQPETEADSVTQAPAEPEHAPEVMPPAEPEPAPDVETTAAFHQPEVETEQHLETPHLTETEPMMDADAFLEVATAPDFHKPAQEQDDAAEIVVSPARPLRETVRTERNRVLETPPVRLSPKSAPEHPDTTGRNTGTGGPPAAEEHHEPVEVPKPPPEEPLTADELRRRYWQKLKEKVGLGSLGWSVAIHLALLILATLIGISQAIDKQVDFLPGGSPAGKAASEALEHKVQQKKNPWLKSKPQLRRVTVQSMASEIQLPEMDMDSLDLSTTERMSLGKLGSIGPAGGGMGMGGAGGGFGAGMGRGGMFSFLGQTAFGRRVVFVCDVSASMSATGEGGVTRFEVLKKELVKSLSRIPPGTQYQILFFSDFAWPHNTIDPKRSAAYEKFRWTITPEEYKSAKIPTYAYLLANGFNLSDSRKIVEEADNPGGTNWGAGLLMALKGNPKPDVIFFMTDGQRSDEMGWVDIVTNENKRVRPQTVIHTSVMMETDAAADMDRLAKSNGGTFSVVLRDGTVVKGDSFLGN
ncbi:MAG: hypothetical protein HS117_00320 [Verrucomicrobiaceae bacterium]|nr:hypothetical protein [Verrucomicrobiaceae bacterium]